MSTRKPTNASRALVILFITVLTISGIYSCNCNNASDKNEQTDTLSSGVMTDSSQVMKMDSLPEGPDSSTKGDQTVPPKKP
jgi:hypothetical protein